MARALARRPGIAAAVLVVECVVALGAGKLLSSSGVLAGAQVVASSALHDVRDAFGAQASASPLGTAAAFILVALALATLWSEGVRGWFAPLRHGPRAV